MAVTVGPERDSDGQPTTLHITYAAGHHVSEYEAEWLRDVISRRSSIEAVFAEHRDTLDLLGDR